MKQLHQEFAVDRQLASRLLRVRRARPRRCTKRQFLSAEWVSGSGLHRVSRELPMSALGQKRTFIQLGALSALPPIADIGTQSWNFRIVPTSDNHPRV
jgi:hypothetical protein